MAFPKKINPENAEKVRYYADKGYSQSQIAEMMGLASATIYRMSILFNIELKQYAQYKNVTDWETLRIVNRIFNSNPISKNPNRMAAY